MKGYQFLINFTLLCLLIVCYCSEGRPFSKISSSEISVAMSKYFVDCGSFPVVTPKPSVFSRRILSRRRPSVSSMMRRISGAYTPAYTCLRAFKLEEKPIFINGSQVVEGVIHYNLDKSSLAKVTSAKLTVSLDGAHAIGEGDRRHLSEIDVMGSVATIFHENRYFPIARIEDEEDRNKKAHLVDFNVTEMLRQASKKASNDENQWRDESENKVTVSFFLTRRCDNLEISCPKIFNTAVHTPSLRLFFI